LFVSNSQVIGCEDRLWNDLYCVGGALNSTLSNPIQCLMCRWHAAVEVLHAHSCAVHADPATTPVWHVLSMRLFFLREQLLRASCLHLD